MTGPFTEVARVEAILRKIERERPDRGEWDALTRAWFDRASILAGALTEERERRERLEAILYPPEAAA